MKNKKIVIIGGSSGIGLNLAKHLLKLGAQVLIASRKENNLKKAKVELGDKIEIHVLDAKNEASVIDFFSQIGDFDHLVTTIKHDHVNSPFSSGDTKAAQNGFNNKFWGQYYCAKHCLSSISNNGSIILTSGIASNQAYSGFSTTAAINGAIESLVKTLAVELAPIRINAVSPGFVERFPNDKDRLESVKKIEPTLKRLITLDEITKVYISLLEDSSRTGKIL
ncbi:SDR family oxidoreductase [bacterium]|jgi:NAD(P)-dependent dehydrogenase (short-subunit alcohol dehydrogenase family)|nr:SDR family oxidoreductase [bacterium]